MITKNLKMLGVLKIVYLYKNFAHIPSTIFPEKTEKKDFWGLYPGLIV